jgi:hypothetical protein
MQVYGKCAWQSTLVAVLPGARITLNGWQTQPGKSTLPGGLANSWQSHSGTLAKGPPESMIVEGHRIHVYREYIPPLPACMQVWLQHYSLQGEELLPAAFRSSGVQQVGSSGLGTGQQVGAGGGSGGGAGDVVASQVRGGGPGSPA